MTDKQQKADRYLKEIRNASKELTELILRIDYLRYKATGTGAIRYDKDHVQTSPEDMVCDAISEAVYLEGKLSSRQKELKDMRRRTEEIISLWGNNEGRAIEIYYLNRGSMVDVARLLECSDRNAYRIRARALNNIYNILW